MTWIFRWDHMTFDVCVNPLHSQNGITKLSRYWSALYVLLFLEINFKFAEFASDSDMLQKLFTYCFFYIAIIQKWWFLLKWSSACNLIQVRILKNIDIWKLEFSLK